MNGDVDLLMTLRELIAKSDVALSDSRIVNIITYSFMLLISI